LLEPVEGDNCYNFADLAQSDRFLVAEFIDKYVLPLVDWLGVKKILWHCLGGCQQMIKLETDPFNELAVPFCRIVREDLQLNAVPQVLHRGMSLITRSVDRHGGLGRAESIN